MAARGPRCHRRSYHCRCGFQNLVPRGRKHRQTGASSFRAPDFASRSHKWRCQSEPLWWINDIFRRGFHKALAIEDLDRLDDALLSEGLNKASARTWASRRQPERRLEFPIAVSRAVMFDFLAIVPPRLCLIGFIFAQPYLFHTILSLLTNDAVILTSTDCCGLVGATAIVYIGLTVLRLNYNQKVNRFKVMFRGASVSLIYDKALQTRDGVYDESAAVTLMSTDVDQMTECLSELNECWARAIEVTLAVSMLAKQLGWVCVMPLALVISTYSNLKTCCQTNADSCILWRQANCIWNWW